MWERIEDRLALVELLVNGALERRAGQADAHAWLAELPWTRATGRRDELRLVPERRVDLVALLDRAWPAWRDEHVALVELGLPPTPSGYGRLLDHRRALALPVLPTRLNRRTAAAMTAPGAKSSLTPERLELLSGSEVVDDGLVRIRPPRGLRARRGDSMVALDEVSAVLDEVGVTDRALRDGLVFEGHVRAVLLVENLGAWRDMPRPEGCLLAHVPGWNTATVRRLLSVMGSVPAIHFGDLDPNGVRIYRHLRAAHPALRWLVPDLWRDYVETSARPCEWPAGLPLHDAPRLVRELAAAGLWMEQEPIVFDPRLPAALQQALGQAET